MILPSKYLWILVVSTGKCVHHNTRQSVFCFFRETRYLSSTCLRFVSSVIPCSTTSTRSLATMIFILVHGLGLVDWNNFVYIPDFMVHSVARTVIFLQLDCVSCIFSIPGIVIESAFLSG